MGLEQSVPEFLSEPVDCASDHVQPSKVSLRHRPCVSGASEDC